MIRFFARKDWLTGLAAFVLMLAVYTSTLSPTITMEMAGPLVVGADHLGVGKFPGFPVWHMIGHVFTRIFSFVEYNGHPNPAWAINFMSAFFGALACGGIALIVSRVSDNLAAASQQPDRYRPIIAAAAVSAAVLFGLSPTMWSQSVIAETHALTNFYLVAFLALILHWHHTGRETIDFLVTLLLGLSVSISQLLFLILPAVLLAAAFLNPRRAVELGIPALSLMWLVLPIRDFHLEYRILVLICFWLFLAVRVMKSARSRRRCLLHHLTIAAGLLPYAYLPIASDLNPPINMGYARTMQGFLHLIGRGQYERIVALNPFREPRVFFEQMEWLLSEIVFQFMAPTAFIGLAAFLSWPFLTPAIRRSLSIVAMALASFSIFLVVGMNDVAHDIQTNFLIRRNAIPVFALWSIFIGCGFVVLYSAVEKWRLRKPRPLRPSAEPSG